MTNCGQDVLFEVTIARMTLTRYLETRRTWEALLVASFVLLSFFANVGIVSIEFARDGKAFDAKLPFILEGTSHVAMALVIPLIFWFDRHFPIRLSTWRVSVPAHAAFSIVVSMLHVMLMYGMRVFLFGRLDGLPRYRWDNWPRELGYEYLKDFRTYAIVLILVYLYGFILRRLQGEAGFLSDSQDSPAPISDRFLIKKLGREFLVRLDEIDWIESCGNYVNLHVGDRVYPLRDTMTSINERLEPHGFQRIHRSAIVNLDRVCEIVASDSGDGEARLSSNATVPVSRRFRKELRDRLA